MKKYYILILTAIVILHTSCDDGVTFNDATESNLPAISEGTIEVYSDHEIYLSWQEPNNAEAIEGYVIERRAESEQSFQIIATTSETSFTDSPLSQTTTTDPSFNALKDVGFSIDVPL